MVVDAVLPEGGYTWHSTVGPWRLDYDNVVAPADDGSRLRFTARLNGPASARIERLVAPLSALGQRRRIARRRAGRTHRAAPRSSRDAHDLPLAREPDAIKRLLHDADAVDPLRVVGAVRIDRGAIGVQECAPRASACHAGDGMDLETANLYDLVIIGGSAGGLSTAISSLRSGLERIRIIESSSHVALPDLIGPNQLDVGFGETGHLDRRGRWAPGRRQQPAELSHVCGPRCRSPRRSDLDAADRPPGERSHPHRRVRGGTDHDVLVVGLADHAVELTAQLSGAGNRVVLAASGMDLTQLSPAADSRLRQLEHDRQVTRRTGRHPSRSTSSTVSQWPISVIDVPRISSSTTSCSHRPV